MNLILLGGNSRNNKKWIETVEVYIKPFFETTTLLNYDHWQTGEWMISLNKEKEKLVEITKGMGSFAIFAKSAGSLVTVKAISEKLINPDKCIFVGVPLKWARKNNFDVDTWYKNYSTPTLAIQHVSDPFASSQELTEFLTSLTSTVQIETLPGDTHDYDEFDTMTKLISDFTK